MRREPTRQGDMHGEANRTEQYEHIPSIPYSSPAVKSKQIQPAQCKQGRDACRQGQALLRQPKGDEWNEHYRQSGKKSRVGRRRIQQSNGLEGISGK